MKPFDSLARHMGVDHGGTSPPRIWSKGTLVQIVPLSIFVIGL